MSRNKKSIRKIRGLLMLMLLTMILAITATYAWFSTQRDVEITGMKLNVEVAESKAELRWYMQARDFIKVSEK